MSVAAPLLHRHPSVFPLFLDQVGNWMGGPCYIYNNPIRILYIPTSRSPYIEYSSLEPLKKLKFIRLIDPGVGLLYQPYRSELEKNRNIDLFGDGILAGINKKGEIHSLDLKYNTTNFKWLFD